MTSKEEKISTAIAKLLILFLVPFAIMYVADTLFGMHWAGKYWSVLLLVMCYKALSNKIGG